MAGNMKLLPSLIVSVLGILQILSDNLLDSRDSGTTADHFEHVDVVQGHVGLFEDRSDGVDDLGEEVPGLFEEG